jgi:hypothetical protein
MPGTHAQNITGVAEELQDLPPASTVALALALLVAPPADVPLLLLPPLLHAASSETAAAPATAMVILRFLNDILVKLLCSVLPCLRAMPFQCGPGGTTARKLPRVSPAAV